MSFQTDPASLEFGPPLVIMDSDGPNDTGDKGNVAHGAILHFEKRIRLLGLVCCTQSAWSPGSYHPIINHALGRPFGEDTEILISSYSGSVNYGASTHNDYERLIAKKFNRLTRSKASYPEAIVAYRTMLSSLVGSGEKAKILLGGGPQAIAEFMASPADAIYNGTGAALAALTVSEIIWEGGYGFPSGTGGPNGNVTQSVAGAQALVAACVANNIPLTFFGDDQVTAFSAAQVVGPPSTADINLSPLAYAYYVWGAAAGGRPPWQDPLFDYLLEGVGPQSNIRWGGQGGTLAIDNSGNTTWNNTPGLGGYLVIDDTSTAALAKMSARYNARYARASGTKTVSVVPPAQDFLGTPGLVSLLRPRLVGTVTGSGATLAVQDLAFPGKAALVPATAGDSGCSAPAPTAPTVVASDINGFQGLAFDGISAGLDLSYLAPLFGGADSTLHAFFVMKALNVTSLQTLLQLAIPSAPNAYHKLLSQISATGTLNLGRYPAGFQSLAQTGTALSTTNYSLVEIIIDPRHDVGSYLTIIVNDGPPSQGGASGCIADVPFSIMRIGQGYGRSTDTTVNPATIHLAELAIFNRVIEGKERDRVIRGSIANPYGAAALGLSSLPT